MRGSTASTRYGGSLGEVATWTGGSTSSSFPQALKSHDCKPLICPARGPSPIRTRVSHITESHGLSPVTRAPFGYTRFHPAEAGCYFLTPPTAAFGSGVAAVGGEGSIAPGFSRV